MTNIEKTIIDIFWKSLDDGSDSLENKDLDKDAQLDLDVDLTEYGLDSIAFIRMIVMLEEEFNVLFPDESMLLEELNTVKKIEDMLQQLFI